MVDFLMVNLGKHTSPMDSMGYICIEAESETSFIFLCVQNEW